MSKSSLLNGAAIGPELIDPARAKGMVHEQIAATSKGLARTFWEKSASTSDKFYRLCPDPDHFVAANWHEFAPIARSIMVDLLADPKFPDAEKEKIKDALLKDAGYNSRQMTAPAKMVSDERLIDQYRTTAVETPSGLILPPNETKY